MTKKVTLDMNECIEHIPISRNQLAEELGISRQALHNKVKGVTPYNTEDIKIIKSLLKKHQKSLDRLMKRI